MSTQGDIQRAVDALLRAKGKAPRDQWTWATVGGKRVRAMLLGRSLVVDGEVSAETVEAVLDGDTDSTPARVLRALPVSHVSAYRGATAQSLSDGATVVYSTKITDTLGEYNPSTGVFTAQRAGRYEVHASLESTTVAWVSGNVWRVGLWRNGVVVKLGTLWQAWAASTREAASSVSHALDLAAGDTLTLVAHHTQGGAVNTRTHATGVYNQLSIDRIA